MKLRAKILIAVFAFITLIILFLRTPFWDETHAFDIACLKISEILYLTRVEGHTFLWYLLLKPFTFLKLYPYPMLILNWIFCTVAITVLWKRAPFSFFVKALITFSTPFLLYFAPVARCYSIGVMFLFLICSVYPLRFKRPYLFSFLIFLCANTSLMAAIGCFLIGAIYLFELIKRNLKGIFPKEKLIKIFLIFLFCTVILLLQFVSIKTPAIGNTADFIKRLIDFVIVPNGDNILAFVFHLFSSITFYFLPFYLFKTSKKALIFIFGTYLILSFVFIFFYHGSFWNHYFYYVYFIVLYWLFYSRMKKNKFVIFLFSTILFFALFPTALHNGSKIECIYSSRSKKVAKFILDNPKYKNSKLYTLEWWSDIAPGAGVYLARNNVKIYDIYNRDRRSFESLKDIFAFKDIPIDFDEFMKNTPEDFYILSMGSILKQKFSNLFVYSKTDGDLIFKTMKKTYLLHQVENQKGNSGLIIFKVFEI